ncbi:sensor histidine kinase [Planomonospora corallina]|uniref:histidine kinase n=1 Tax=Planomonospora corallina TaxID=1806052 RepID=A0ABV8IIP4_9ACTN
MTRTESSRAATTAALASVVAATLMTAVTVALDVRSAHVRIPAAAQLEPGWPTALTGLAQLVPGALLLRRLPRHPVAWVLTGFGLLWILDALAASWAVHGVYVSPGAPGTSAAYWFYARFGASLLLSLPLLILLFPDGRLPASRPWRALSAVSLALTGLLTLLLVTVPAQALVRFHTTPLPPEIARLDLDPFVVALPYTFWEAALRIAYVGALVSLVVPFAVTVRRYRAAGRERRAQIRWLMWAALVDMLVLLLPLRVPPQLPALLFGLSVAITSAAVLVAVTKYRLYDVDRLLSATVTYALLAGLVVLADVAVFTAAGRVLGERDSALAAIAIVAVVYAPLRTRLARAVRRLVRGTRDDPYAAVSTLAERLELATDPGGQLLAVAATLTEAFRLSYLRVEIEGAGGSRSVVEHGSPRGEPVALPVAYRGEVVGRLLLCRTDLTERDQRLLGDLVRQAAAAARASELSTDLQRIRARLVLAREEERRRLRRDLHDGLGPSLGAVALRIEAARNLAATAPERADAILAETAAEVGGVLADVRRLVHDLRPPALDELGLLRAIEQQAERFRSPGLDVVVGGEGPLETLPAAVEVAAYRIVAEALANVARHAGAARCEITLAVRDGSLRVTVRDDGSGIGPEVAAGVGMLSLRERAAELGGDCGVSCPAEGGTLVEARLPAGQAMEVADV